jgi:hypothetical protein
MHKISRRFSTLVLFLHRCKPPALKTRAQPVPNHHPQFQILKFGKRSDPNQAAVSEVSEQNKNHVAVLLAIKSTMPLQPGLNAQCNPCKHYSNTISLNLYPSIPPSSSPKVPYQIPAPSHHLYLDTPPHACCGPGSRTFCVEGNPARFGAAANSAEGSYCRCSRCSRLASFEIVDVSWLTLARVSGNARSRGDWSGREMCGALPQRLVLSCAFWAKLDTLSGGGSGCSMARKASLARICQMGWVVECHYY